MLRLPGLPRLLLRLARLGHSLFDSRISPGIGERTFEFAGNPSNPQRLPPAAPTEFLPSPSG